MRAGQYPRRSITRLSWVLSLSAVLISGQYAIANGPTPGGYRVGLNFVNAPHVAPGLGWTDDNDNADDTFYPFSITGPATNAVTDGGMAGWSESAARRAITLAVEDAYRAVNVGNPNQTLAIQIYEGPLAAAGPGRRINAVLGENLSMPNGMVGFSVTNGAFDPTNRPNGSDIATIMLDNLDLLGGVQFTQSSYVINNIAGTTAHEIGHSFGLDHVPAGDLQPFPIMASGGTGLHNEDRLTVRRFETTPSASLLLSGIGTVAKSDFTMNGSTNLAGDGAALITNLGRSDALFQEGDANGDHHVNLAGDMSAVVANLAADSLSSGAMAKYDPASGEIWISANGPLQLVLYSLDHHLTGSDVANTTAPFKLQVGTVKDISLLPNSLAFFNGDGFLLNDVSAGLLIAPGTSLADLSFTYQNSGEDPVFGPIYLIPEPTSFVLAALAGIGLAWFRWRRGHLGCYCYVPTYCRTATE